MNPNHNWFSAHREMRTITNYFLLNLSVADLLMSSLNGIFNFISMVNSDWPFGSLYCSVNNFMAYATVASSVFTLVAISFDRYVAIVRPLHRRNSRKKARIFLTIIWSMSSVLSFPGLIYSTTESKRLVWCSSAYRVNIEFVYVFFFICISATTMEKREQCATFNGPTGDIHFLQPNMCKKSKIENDIW